MLRFNIINFIILLIVTTGCINKHGISAKYYSDCKEYYDMQGYYHKKCGDDDIITYKKINNTLKIGDTQPKGNVW